MKASYILAIETLENHPDSFVSVGLKAGPDFPAWRPGQFLSLRRSIRHRDVIRSYSIASLPSEGLQLLVRREANGVFSRWLADEARVGDTLETLAPSGNFVLPETPEPIQNLVLLAAGSGIAPIRALGLQALREGGANRTHLLYSAYSEDKAPFLKELAGLARPDLTLTLFLSQQANRLNSLKLEGYLAASAISPGLSSLFFLCGPISYRRMVRFTLRTLGFGPAQIREESFDLINTRPPAQPMLAKPATVTVVHPGGTETAFSCAPDESILTAGLRNGIDMPYSCRGGVCSSCMAVLLQGSTYMTINEILAPDDLARNLTLTCTALPASEAIRLRLGPDLL